MRRSSKPCHRSPSLSRTQPSSCARRSRIEHPAARAQDPRRLAQHAAPDRRRGAAPATAARRRRLRSSSGSFSMSPRFQVMLRDLAPLGERLARASTAGRAIDGDHRARPARGLERSGSLRRSRCRRRRAAAAGGRAPATTPPSCGPGTSWRPSRVSGPACASKFSRRSRSTSWMRASSARAAAVPPARANSASSSGHSGSSPPAGPGAGGSRSRCRRAPRDQAGVLEQPEVPRHARLGQPEDAGELDDVEAVERQRPQQPQPRRVAQQPEERRDRFHIHKSICR